MVTPTVTPLKKHPGQRGGLIALTLLVATVAVVWINHPRPATSTVSTVFEKLKPKPQASVATPRTLERPALMAIESSAGIETAVVGERDLPRQVIASGPVSFDESRTFHVSAPVAGWLRKYPHGRTVRAGETLGVIISPEVYLATSDLITQRRDFKSQTFLDDARMRLYRWGMRQEMVTRIEQTLKPEAALPLIARVSGTIVGEKQLSTPFVERGDAFFTITDPSSASLYVDIPAEAAALARVGMTARVTIDGIRRPVSAPIGYISRRASEGKHKVRFDLHDTGVRMPPTVEATAELALGTAHGPAIADSAIVRTDDRTFVYVARGAGMEPREVKLGPSKDGWVLVTSGLAAGETIAADAKHLVPSN